jgi:pyruvate formate lyase activating enzyme
MLYERHQEKLRCLLCPHHCTLELGQSGLCGVRANTGTKIENLFHGKVSSMALDPIEKKPLFHFYPGSDILSIGSIGCNLKCNFCQNWKISQACHEDSITLQEYPPEQITKQALKTQNNIGIAFTYNEPTVWFEYLYDIAKSAKQKNLKTVMVSNGYIKNSHSTSTMRSY